MTRTTRRIQSYRIALGASMLFAFQGLAGPNPLERRSENPPTQHANPLERASSPRYHGPVLDLPMRLEGDGLVMDVQEYNPATTDVTGSIRLGGAAYPFTARYADPTRLGGTFDAGGTAYEFVLVSDAGVGHTLTTGQSSYALRDTRPASRTTPNGSAEGSEGADRAELERASRAMGAGDYAAALRIARPLADRGHVGACYLVGTCQAFGMGMDQDLGGAKRSFETAARGDHPGAHFELGAMANEGVLGEPDQAAAIASFERAARLGDTNAILAFGEMTLNGIGRRADFVEGVAWAGVAARRGSRDAQGLIDYYNDDTSVSREDRQRVGERIAELERTLPDASDLDDLVDYNRFVPVSPAARRTDDSTKPHADSIAGTWTGTLSEEMDYGQMMQCPMTIDLAQGSHGAYSADVTIDIRMPAQNGQMLDIRATGRFTGSVQNGRGALRANDTTMTVRQTGEQASVGAQQMEFTISGTTITGRLGNEFEGYSEFRATRDTAPTGGFGAGGGGDHTPDRRGASSWGTGGEASAGLGRPEQRAGESHAASVTLEPVTLTDPQMGGAPSHTLLVPEGWSQTGGVSWNVPQLYQDMVHLDLQVTAPDGTSFGYYPGANYTWSDIFQLNAQMGVPGSGPPPSPGTITGEGLTFMPLPQTTGDYVQTMLMPMHRPNATDVRVTQAQEMPEVLATMREMLGPTLRSIEQQNASMRHMGGGQMQMSPFADRVSVTYTENGQRFQEDVFVTGYAIITQMPMATGQVTTMARWGVEDVRTVRSPAGGSENRAIADAASLSVRPDPKWLATVIDMRAQINKTVSDGIAERGRINRQMMEESFQRHQETVRERQASNDRMHHQFINYIRDVEDYRTPSGNVVQLPNQYNNAYMNGQGQVIMTNQTLGSGTGWTQLNRVRP